MAQVATDRNTIITKGDGMQYEAPAEAAITPGQLVELIASGNVQKQATAKANVERAFAIEDYLQGGGIADDYAVGANVLYRVFKSGDEVLAILADNNTVVIGDEVEAALAGEVQLLTSAGTNPIGVATEALDSSNSAVTPVANRRIVIRIK